MSYYVTADAYKAIILSCILYFICPLLSLIILFSYTLSLSKDKKKSIFYLCFFLLALYVGLINSTKIPENDQVMYHEAYRLVPHRSLLMNLTGIYGTHGELTTKEMGYGLLNIVGYYLTFGNYPLFVTLFTIVLYMLYYDAIYKWFKFLNVEHPTTYILSAVLTLTFFTQFFNLTIHLQRQMIATAIIIHALIQTIIKNKVPWLIVILGTTLHTSVGLFLPLFLLLQFKKTISLKSVFTIVFGLILLISSLGSIANALLSHLGDDVYALNRLQNMAESADREEAMGTNLVAIISVPLVLISLINLLSQKKKRVISREAVLYLFYFVNIAFSTFCINNTMQYRYFMMSYSFIPFILPLLSKEMKFYEKAWLCFVPLALFCRFYLTFENIVFKYAPVEYVALGNVFTLFNYNNI